MKQLTEQNKVYKRKIKALKVSIGDGEETKEAEDTTMSEINLEEKLLKRTNPKIDSSTTIVFFK